MPPGRVAGAAAAVFSTSWPVVLRLHSARMTAAKVRRWYRDATTPAVLLYWRRTTTVVMSARADRPTVLSVDLSRAESETVSRTVRPTSGHRPVIDGACRRWQGVVPLIRRVVRSFRCRQIGRPPDSMCPRVPGASP